MTSVETGIKGLGNRIALTFDTALMSVLTKFSIRIPLPERNPFQLILLIFVFIADTIVLTHADVGPKSLTVAGAFSTGVTWVIAIGSLFAILGIIWRDREVGLAFEQYAHSVLCFGSWGYVFAVIGYNGLSSGILVVGYTAGVAVGAWARACHILFFNRQMAVLTGRSKVSVPGGPYDTSR